MLATVLLGLLAGGLALPAVAQQPETDAEKPGRRPLRVVFALDNSGSMKFDGLHERVRQATAELVDQFGDDDEVGLVLFDAGARVVVQPARLGEPDARKRLQGAIRGVAFDGRHTNIPDGVERALYELRRATADSGRGIDSGRVMVVLTDGVIDTGSAQRNAEQTEWLRDSLLPDCKKSDVRIFGVAFTENADYRLLQTMAQRTGGDYFRALTPDDVASVVPSLQAALEERLAAPKPVETAAAAATPSAAPPAQPPKVEIHRVEVPVPVPTPAAADGESSALSPTLMTLALVALVLGLSIVVVALMRGRSAQVAVAPLPAGADEPIPPGVSLKGISTEDMHDVTTRVTTVGRSEDNDVVIPERTVSGNHARIEMRDGFFYLADLRSMNGTFVNEKKVEGETILRDGDVLRFDRFAFRFQGGLPAGFATVLGGVAGDDIGAGDRTMLTPAAGGPRPVEDIDDLDASAGVGD